MSEKVGKNMPPCLVFWCARRRVFSPIRPRQYVVLLSYTHADTSLQPSHPWAVCFCESFLGVSPPFPSRGTPFLGSYSERGHESRTPDLRLAPERLRTWVPPRGGLRQAVACLDTQARL